MPGRSEVGCWLALVVFFWRDAENGPRSNSSQRDAQLHATLRDNRPTDRPTEQESGEMNAARLQQSAQPTTAGVGQGRAMWGIMSSMCRLPCAVVDGGRLKSGLDVVAGWARDGARMGVVMVDREKDIEWIGNTGKRKVVKVSRWLIIRIFGPMVPGRGPECELVLLYAPQITPSPGPLGAAAGSQRVRDTRCSPAAVAAAAAAAARWCVVWNLVEPHCTGQGARSSLRRGGLG